jgi:serine protease
MCATTAAGLANNIAGGAGIAWGITILPVKVLDYLTRGTQADISSGIRYAADQGADIANLSLGFPSRSFWLERGLPENVLAHMFDPLEEAVRYAQRRGTILVAAAGNFHRSEIGPPASLPGVISVAATRVDDSLASYSSWGKGLSFIAPGGDFTDLNHDDYQDAIPTLTMRPLFGNSLAAPDTFLVWPFFGTSAAAPHVSGAIALLMSLGMRDQGSIEQVLRQTAIHPWGDPTDYSPVEGFGLIQIDKAVRLAASKHRLANALNSGSREGVALRVVNPARGGATLAVRMKSAGPLRVRLFDVRGSLVRTLEQGPSPAGERTVFWDGTNDRGEPAANGVYFFRVDTQDGVTTRRIAFLR